jgi:adenine-specific DNA methylase
MSVSYPKRLIEVDLPIKKISEHARREKSIRHGHISTLHIWWARRPLAACRAVICAALWPDPADPVCPEKFKIEAKKQMAQFWNTVDTTTRDVNDPVELRKALLDFIADFSNWDNSTEERYLNTARALTQAAHEALGGEPGTRPLVVDPFAGGGSIPLEALRVGADAYASDLNPVAVLLNKVVLEYIPKYGQELADEVRKWGQWVKEEAEKELAEFYPKDPDGSTPIAYLWARTITCEGPGCGCEVPLIRSLWLAKKGARSVALRLIPNPTEKRVDFEIIHDAKPSDVKEGTVKRGSATCPCCGYTTPVASVRKQLKARHGGADDARMFCVVTTKSSEQGRFYRLPTQRDLDAVQKAKEELDRQKREWQGELSLVPDEPSNDANMFNNSVPLYGMTKWEHIFSNRQKITILTFIQFLKKCGENLKNKDNDFKNAFYSLLACAIDRQIEHSSTLCRWNSSGAKMQATFGRQAFPMIWDYCETNPFGGSVGSFSTMVELILIPFDTESLIKIKGKANRASATKSLLPDNSVDCFFTDPPYYYSIQYAGLSDFFYVWLHRILGEIHPELFNSRLSPKNEEIVVSSPIQADAPSGKNNDFYERELTKSLNEGRKITKNTGVGLFVFAQLQTAAWESFIQGLINSGWIITGSWPLDTEMNTRILSMRQSVLASSIHLICRPREKSDGTTHEEIGEWSDILAELPIRIKEWMPRLKQENIVGADAIFACLGPALEIFSRYSQVEKASGEQVTLKEYLEKVWEAVEKEALTMIFEGADASGFEEDARLTAMWLWTLKAGANGESSSAGAASHEEDSDVEADESAPAKPVKVAGYGLEYDAARKIAQGLGAHPEQMTTLIEIKKGNARLLSVAERASYLFGKEDLAPKRRLKKREAQMTLFPGETVTEEPVTNGSLGELSSIGKTTLDRVHQSMLLFGHGQSDALKRFLVDEGIGKDPQFKKLAQALVALYPAGSDEKRWAEGVMSRMKGLGL